MSRTLLIAIAAAALAVPSMARAESRDDDPHVWPRRTRVLSIGGGAQYLANESIGGPALFGEYGLGHGRWQWVPNGAVQAVFGDGPRPTGWGVRAGLDARWLARTFEPDHSASLQMFMNGGLGLQHVAMGGDTITRPVLGVGWGVQVRGLEDHHWTIRIAFRFEVAPALDRATVDRVVCHGTCSSAPSDAPVDEGFQTMLGVGW